MGASPPAGRTRRRLGVAVVLDAPLAREVDGLRRAVGDPGLARVVPHVTLVPPVNVRADDLPAALDIVRRAAARIRPFRLTLGPVATFLPVNPVLYLAVGGDTDPLRGLRDAVFRGPLERRLSWPWVPHVTLADSAPEDRIAAALAALDAWSAVVDVERVVVLEEGPGRVWSALADAGLGPPARVGTGGLVLELTRGRLVDPRLESPPVPTGVLLPPLVVNAHREGEPVGWARVTVTAEGPGRQVYVRPEHRRQGIGGHLRAHLEWAFRASLAADGPPPGGPAYSKATDA